MWKPSAKLIESPHEDFDSVFYFFLYAMFSFKHVYFDV